MIEAFVMQGDGAAMPHVLIIEDSYLFGQFVSDAAVLAGAASVEVVDTQAAAEAAASRRTPNIIIADVKLRHGSGVKAVEHIVAGERDIPVLYVTGYPEHLSGCPTDATIVEKPVSHDALRLTIGQLIADRRTRSSSLH
ncbi:hypothetical protein GCM10009102_07810 [Sphingomonas insulae]|uniref:Response regulatory domain-containing protein n=2 Tax=Sphingomonas insulae TaxID=424800 RepID=A0ABP3SSC0_9SPHN